MKTLGLTVVSFELEAAAVAVVEAVGIELLSAAAAGTLPANCWVAPAAN